MSHPDRSFDVHDAPLAPDGRFQHFPKRRPTNLHADPLAQLAAWLEEARMDGDVDPRAMTLSTIGASGAPSSRIVALKEVAGGGLVFTSHHAAPKVAEITADPRASAVFYWPSAGRQVRASGAVSRLAENVSQGYFEERPRAAQLALHVATPGQEVPDRQFLVRRLATLEREHAGRAVPRPDWGAYVLIPHTVEFWQGHTDRLHDRWRYLRSADSWRLARLAP